MMVSRQAPSGRRARWGAICALLLALAGCGTPPAPTPASHALRPGPTGILAAAEEAWQRRHGDGLSLFLLLERNLVALAWRLALCTYAPPSKAMSQT